MWSGVQHALRTVDHHRRYDRLLDTDRLLRPANGPADTYRVLQEGPPLRPRLEAHPAGSGHFAAGSRRHTREYPLGATRLVGGLHGYLVLTVHGWQLPLRPHGACAAAPGRVHRQRPGPALRDEPA